MNECITAGDLDFTSVILSIKILLRCPVILPAFNQLHVGFRAYIAATKRDCHKLLTTLNVRLCLQHLNNTVAVGARIFAEIFNHFTE